MQIHFWCTNHLLASDLRALVQLDGGKNSFGRLTCNALNLKPA